jgi:hypothetical protein
MGCKQRSADIRNRAERGDYNDVAQTALAQRDLNSLNDRIIQTTSYADDPGKTWKTVTTDGSCGGGVQTVRGKCLFCFWLLHFNLLAFRANPLSILVEDMAFQFPHCARATLTSHDGLKLHRVMILWQVKQGAANAADDAGVVTQ